MLLFCAQLRPVAASVQYMKLSCQSDVGIELKCVYSWLIMPHLQAIQQHMQSLYAFGSYTCA